VRNFISMDFLSTASLSLSAAARMIWAKGQEEAPEGPRGQS
jgi:hypothetical protein